MAAASAWGRLKRHTQRFQALHQQACSGAESSANRASSAPPWQGTSLAADLGRLPAVVAGAICAADGGTGIRLPAWLVQLFAEPPGQDLGGQQQVRV